jgi:hypothetical protein
MVLPPSLERPPAGDACQLDKRALVPASCTNPKGVRTYLLSAIRAINHLRLAGFDANPQLAHNLADALTAAVQLAGDPGRFSSG